MLRPWSALEILETTEGSYRGSLLEFLNKTTTPFGFRLLKQWLCSPLYEAKSIRSRQEACVSRVSYSFNR